MERGKTMLLNTLLLTATAILMRTVGMVFQVYLSKKIGAAVSACSSSSCP